MKPEEKRTRFRAYLKELHGQRFAVYGTGVNAKDLLPLLAGENVAGFLDGKRTEGMFHAWPMLALEDLPARGVRQLFLAAQITSAKAICDRIAPFCWAHGIAVRGLCAEGDLLQLSGPGLRGYADDEWLTKEDVLREIDRHEVISFDLFDTLLMRRTLEPTDVFALVAQRARAQGISLPSFSIHRRRAELYVLRHGHHTLAAIYQQLQQMCGWTDAVREKVMRWELDVEREVLLPRQDMVDCLAYACQLGKRVYIITDMYLPSVQLEQFLQAHGIRGFQKILVSGEYGCGKSDGLFDVFRKEVPGASYLHIGDNKVADGLAARLAGIDACVIRSALALLRLSRYHALEDFTGTMNDRMLLGMMLARIANSPFSLREDKTFTIADFGQYAYTFLAPVLMALLVWLLRIAKEVPCEAILFAARDGYLIQQLYDLACQRKEWRGLPPSKYFYTSRKAAIKCGIHDEQTLKRAKEEYGTDRMCQLFGVGEAEGHEKILAVSAEAQACFRAYLERERLSEDGSYLLYDFCSQGTTQAFLQSAGMTSLTGCFFQYLLGMNFRALRICAYDEAIDMATNPFFLARMIFEAVNASPQPSLEGYTETGKPVFSSVVQWQNDGTTIREGQQQILRFAERYLGFYDAQQPISKGWVRQIAVILREQYPAIAKVLEKLRIGDTVDGTLFRIE